MDFGKKLFKQQSDRSSNEENSNLESHGIKRNEPFFCYWLYPFSQWPSIIDNFETDELIIPFNWEFHSKTGDKIDFGLQKAETDLKAIVNLCQDRQLSCFLLLPLSPMPLIRNGGVPALLARTEAINAKGLRHCSVDSEGKFNKYYSYYDPRIIRAYSLLAQSLKSYFYDAKMSIPVIGGDFGSYFQDYFHGTIEDYSKTGFFESYKRYLSSIEDENKVNKHLEADFRFETTQLFEEFFKEEFGNLWKGSIKINFQGASSYETFLRGLEVYWHEDIVKNYLYAASKNCYTSHGLLTNNEINSNVCHYLNTSEIKNCFVEKVLMQDLLEDELNKIRPLIIFNLLVSRKYQSNSNWQESGLIPHIQRNFRWCYREVSSVFNEEGQSPNIIIASASYLTNEDLTELLKQFFSGGKIILDISDIDPTLEKRINLFQIENNLAVEKVNFVTTLEHTSLGEGVFITYDGKKLVGKKQDKQNEFWQRLIGFFDLRMVNVEIESGVEYFWSHCQPSVSDLSFEQKRSLHLLNSTSHKKRIKVDFQDNFALLNIQNDFDAEVKSSKGEFQITLKPDTFARIDFGVYEL